MRRNGFKFKPFDMSWILQAIWKIIEGKDDFEYLLGRGDWFEQQIGHDAGDDRLLEETKKKMLPDECPKLNRAQSTRDNKGNEVVKLIMWLVPVGTRMNMTKNQGIDR